MERSEQDLTRRTKERDRAIAAIEGALERLGQQGRQLDDWERVHLVDALVKLFAGLYRGAAFDARLAETPPNERSIKPLLPKDPIYKRFDLDSLRKVLDHGRGELVLPHPVFGGWRLK